MSGAASAFTSSVRYLRALEQLYRRGESQTSQGHALRAQLEDLWSSLSIEEQDLLDALSADLRSSAEAPAPVPALRVPLRPKFVSRYLAQNPLALRTAEVARLRALLASVGLPFLAVPPGSSSDQPCGVSTGERRDGALRDGPLFAPIEDHDRDTKRAWHLAGLMASAVNVLGPLLDVYEAAADVAAHRGTPIVDAEAWHRERSRLAEALDSVLARARHGGPLLQEKSALPAEGAS